VKGPTDCFPRKAWYCSVVSWGFISSGFGGAGFDEAGGGDETSSADGIDEAFVAGGAGGEVSGLGLVIVESGFDDSEFDDSGGDGFEGGGVVFSDGSGFPVPIIEDVLGGLAGAGDIFGVFGTSFAFDVSF
jgi:hypothetical protein